jgi:hypothetical protein
MRLALHLSLLVVLAFSSCQTAQETVAVPTSVKGYKEFVEDRLGPLWYRRVELNPNGISVGTVSVKFEIPAAGGHPRKLRLISNTGNKIDELTVRIAVGQLRAPPIPPAILEQIHQDRLTFEETFTIFDRPLEPAPFPSALKKR